MKKYLEHQTIKRGVSMNSQHKRLIGQLHEETERLYKAVDTYDQAVSEALGINRSDLRGLKFLQYGPLTPKQMAEKLSLTSGTVTPLLDRLESLDLIRRNASATDRRSLVIELTADGYTRLGNHYERIGREFTKVFKNRSVQELELVIESLQLLRQACDPTKPNSST
jgi:DNA-binding MarR family transcriptional regulator